MVKVESLQLVSWQILVNSTAWFSFSMVGFGFLFRKQTKSNNELKVLEVRCRLGSNNSRPLSHIRLDHDSSHEHLMPIVNKNCFTRKMQTGESRESRKSRVLPRQSGFRLI